ncbi:hypothetical protein N781_02655 [Pontibacillus halophilus JSM 076056 = DSM 19796]|uniref:DUF2584 domain-containing protein n=1 Tax=Pontibacillus halophilus JSM 076056 = DSM 19796 TaxID=1385510 RepID=A0A0A5GL62_9BACI|nr:DUF2584 family protein [Pontibacillus halophilus]KGX91953.1 hypothetical protein N781_02655 [Pontibacillus halophilus JSM 076056 = DSM 19796]
MTMPLTMEWTITTEGKEKRVQEKENTFTLTLQGYQVFPLEQELHVYRYSQDEHVGKAQVKELHWAKGKTTITYQLISLYSVN